MDCDDDRLVEPGGETVTAPASVARAAWLPAEAASEALSSHRRVTPVSAVPDVLGPGVQVLFCGINPGRASAAAGAHFANPRNDFWRLLYTAGFTPRLYEPREQFELLALGIGLTNAARRTTKGSSELRAADFAGSTARLRELAEELVPRVIAFVGKAAYQGVFRGRAEYGLQPRALGEAALFVLPSTSPANAAVPWAERLRWFSALRDFVGD